MDDRPVAWRIQVVSVTKYCPTGAVSGAEFVEENPAR